MAKNSPDEMIPWAFLVKEYQVSGPRWLNDDSECFDIDATVPSGTAQAQVRLMLRVLLEERFKLAFHRERRMFPVYQLEVLKGGPRLEPANPEAKPGVSYEGSFRSRIHSKNTSTAEFANLLSIRLGHPVIDKTGIRERFAIDLEIPERRQRYHSSQHLHSDSGQDGAPAANR